ncbi:hypothetical protein ACWC09_52500 [Streptomyces sp. NPDC001617]
MGFAALHELLWPVTERISRQPQPQPQAKPLNEARHERRCGGLVPDRRGRTELVGELAEERPVLIIADEAQWLDEPSAVNIRLLLEAVDL